MIRRNGRHHRIGVQFAFIAILAGTLVGSIPQSAVAGMINIDLRVPAGSTFNVGQTVPVEVWFVSTTSPTTEWASADVIFEWSSFLSFSGYVDEPIPNLTGKTAAKKPAENGIVWTGSHVNFGGVLPAEDAPGTHVTTLLLKADATGSAMIHVLAGDLGMDTVIYDAEFNDITGGKGGVGITIKIPEPVSAMLLAVGLLVCRPRWRIS